MTKIGLLVVIIGMSLSYSHSATSGTRRPCQLPDALELETEDIHSARQLGADNPLLPLRELAQQIPITALQLDLVQWMHDDLVAYVENHDDIWKERQLMRPGIFMYMTENNPHRPHHDLACQSMEQFQSILNKSERLTLRDFYYLVSIFVLPDADDSSRSAVDLALDTVGFLGKGSLPDLGLVFTTQALGFRRLAKRFRQWTQYIRLCSHRSPVEVRGSFMFPYYLFTHDLVFARFTHGETADIAARWQAVHDLYEETFPETNPDADMCDLVYFLRTHEQQTRSSANIVYEAATMPEYREWLIQYGGDEWDHVLITAIEKVSSFLYDNPTAAADFLLHTAITREKYTIVSKHLK